MTRIWDGYRYVDVAQIESIGKMPITDNYGWDHSGTWREISMTPTIEVGQITSRENRSRSKARYKAEKERRVRNRRRKLGQCTRCGIPMTDSPTKACRKCLDRKLANKKARALKAQGWQRCESTGGLWREKQ